MVRPKLNIAEDVQGLKPLLKQNKLLDIVEQELEGSVPGHFVLADRVAKAMGADAVLVGVELVVEAALEADLAAHFFPLLRNFLDDHFLVIGLFQRVQRV